MGVIDYKAPKVKVVEMNVQNILCQSNEPMGEEDISGSFTQN